MKYLCQFNKAPLHWSLHGTGHCPWTGLQLILCQASYTRQVGTLEFTQVTSAISIHQARAVRSSGCHLLDVLLRCAGIHDSCQLADQHTHTEAPPCHHLEQVHGGAS